MLLRQKIDLSSVDHPGELHPDELHPDEFALRMPGYKKFFQNYTYSVHALHFQVTPHGVYYFYLHKIFACRVLLHTLYIQFFKYFSLNNCILQLLQNYEISFHRTLKLVKTCFRKSGLNLHCPVLTYIL